MGWNRGAFGCALSLVCACSGRGLVNDEGDGESEGSSDSNATMVSIGSMDDSVDDGASMSSGADDAVDTADDGPQAEDQEWLLALSSFLDPNKPLQWHVVVDYEDGVLIDVRLQSLSLDMGATTTPRLPVGDVTVTDQLVVDDVGNFALAIPHLVVPGAANPITASEIVVDNLRFTGMGTLGTSCGTVEGDVTQPIATPLTGSTFAAVPITSVNELPLEFPTACQ